MNKQKKKLLWVGEASYLNSGYSNYSKELLTRLYKLGKYEIAELAGYGTMNDPRVKTIPWKYYANNHEPTDPEDVRKFYKSRVENEFGEWRFDKTLLDFQPDVVCDIRDPWMTAFEQNSHLRPYFSHLIMPTADSLYLLPDWVSSYKKAEGVLTYTEWSKKVLDEEGGGAINTLGAAPYGIDYELYCPPNDKRAHKEKYGISGDSIIFGTVMRNQKRKLFPDLMQAFANALDTMPEDIAKKCYLYLHTSYPDKSCWDIPRLIRETGIGSKVLVSYICKFCKRDSVLVFQDARARCPHCNNIGCVMPNVGMGHTREQLADIFRLFDLYIQYSISEGFGIPQIEAAACGVPVAAVDFSAMQDIVERIEGYKIKIARYYREFESHMLRAYPDNDHLTEIMVKFAQLPEDYRLKRGMKTRKLSMEYFNWDRVVRVWENAIDNLSPPKRNWDDPPIIIEDIKKPDSNLSNEDFVKELFTSLYYIPENIHNLTGMNLLRDLNFGVSVTASGMDNLDRGKIVERLIGKNNGRNLAEKARCGLIQIDKEPFVAFANNRSVKAND